ncbi:42741_t:CDS:2 [Gigaspora margarita]|uniref:42741_t:CDS:1 n=1 Tax=Gigaspora margarita TaxID=4874 RepID=A0ABN7VJU1_GIGMA|nr:42741_t:CDS:2 [Gigaspora margarita]
MSDVYKSTNGTQAQFNNSQPQRLQNTNIGGQPRPQSNTNQFNNTFDLVNGSTDPFNRMQSIEHTPQQDIQFSTSLFSGLSFP